MSEVKTFAITVKRIGDNLDDWYFAMDDLSDIAKKYSDFTERIASYRAVNVLTIQTSRFTGEDVGEDLRKLQNKHDVEVHLFDVSFTWSWK